jgi:hypothetical protein
MSGRGAALGGEREVAPLRRFEIEHSGAGHLELGRPVVGLGVLGRAGDGVDEPVLAQVAAFDEVPQDRRLLVLGQAELLRTSTASVISPSSLRSVVPSSRSIYWINRPFVEGGP